MPRLLLDWNTRISLRVIIPLQSRRTPRDWLNTCKRQKAWPVSTQFKHVPPKATRYRSYTCPHFTYSAAHCLNHKMQRDQQAGATQAKAQLAIFPAGASAALSVRLCLARMPKACYSLTFPLKLQLVKQSGEAIPIWLFSHTDCEKRLMWIWLKLTIWNK